MILKLYGQNLNELAQKYKRFSQKTSTSPNLSVEIPEENNKRGGIGLVLDRLRVELKRNKLKTMKYLMRA